MKKKFLAYTLALALSLSTFIPKNVLADSNLLYVDKETQTITDSLIYEKSERLYKSGWKDVHVLTVDLTNPNVDIEILDSVTEHGLKKNVESLVKENNAIAGINADFFGSGNPGSSMGQIIVDGNVNEAQNYYNASSNSYAGIFLDKYGNAFLTHDNYDIDTGAIIDISNTIFDSIGNAINVSAMGGCSNIININNCKFVNNKTINCVISSSATE